MKKYLTLAALLGAIAFLSVSYLAQADEAVAPAAPAVAADAPATAPVVAPELTGYAKDFADCDAISSAATAEGSTAPTAEEKAAANKKCLIGKGHTEEEITKEEDAKKAAAAAAAAETTSEAPAAPEAPAAK